MITIKQIYYIFVNSISIIMYKMKHLKLRALPIGIDSVYESFDIVTVRDANPAILDSMLVNYLSNSLR